MYNMCKIFDEAMWTKLSFMSLHVARRLFGTGEAFGSLFSNWPPLLYSRGVLYA